MPDEFPTLEVVALIGALVALLRTLELGKGYAELVRRAPSLEQALASGELDRARAVCRQTRGAIFATLGGAVLGAVEAGLGPDGVLLAAEHALTQARRALDRGRARDFVGVAVLIGAGAYALQGSLGVGAAFYALIGTALSVTLIGALLRAATWRRLAAHEGPLTRAAVAAAEARGQSAPDAGRLGRQESS